MRALVLTHGQLAVQEVPDPALEPGDALVRVERAGICSTDLKIWRRGHRLWGGGPAILGHEAVGRVVRIAGAPADPRTGRRVVLAPNIGCGRCPACRRGWDSLCPDYRALGVGLDGCMAEYVRVPAHAAARGALVPCPETLPADVAVLAEPLSTCYRGLQLCRLAAGESVLIVGAGPMGLLAMLLARAMGGAPVIVAQRSGARRELARSLGADAVLDPVALPLPEQVREATGGSGADVALVTAGSAAAQREAIEALAVGGRANLFAGLPAGESMAEFPSNLVHYRQLAVVGSTGAGPDEAAAVLQLLAAGRLPGVERLSTHCFDLEQGTAAFTAAESRQGMRVLLRP